MDILHIIAAWFKSTFQLKSDDKDLNSEEYVWCIVGNIVNEHYWGEAKVIKRGSKHFRPGDKVFCLPEFGGIAHEGIRVIGKPRKQKRFINVVIRTKLIKNFRVQKVYHPKVLNDIKKHSYYRNNSNSKIELKKLKDMAKYLSTLTEEVI